MNAAEDFLKTRTDIAGLTVFSALRKHPLIRTFGSLLKTVSRRASAEGFDAANAPELIRHWAALSETLIRQDRMGSFYSRIAFLTLTDDNPFTRRAEQTGAAQIPPMLRTLAANDLARLGRIAAFDLPRLGSAMAGSLRSAGLEAQAAAVEAEAGLFGKTGNAAELPWETLFPERIPWDQALPALTEHIRTHGAGELGLYRSFRWFSAEKRRSLRPVLHPDPIGLSDLSGYEDQRSIVRANTLRFLDGKTANNLLLYGDRGTGKSATVKAVCNEYASQGLRLLELHKGDLADLPVILDLLASRSLRFIVFIDDLSFETTDDAFTALKAFLEGGVETRPDNVVIYATSNRRHLVKERLMDRPTTAMAADAASTGDVRAFDTMQEQFSLADRFGVTVVYAAPSQDEYLEIACFIAKQRGMLTAASGEKTLQRFREDALRWERWFNGRSPRTAVQYVDWVAGGGGFPWEIEPAGSPELLSR